MLKPKIVFFGDNVSAAVKNHIYDRLSECDSLLIIGSSLHVYSSYRFALAANEQKIPMAILNIGPTRADKFADLIISAAAGKILPSFNRFNRFS